MPDRLKTVTFNGIIYTHKAQNSFLCPMCLEWTPNEEKTDYSINCTDHLSEESTELEICKRCKRTIKSIGLYSTASRQERARELGLTPLSLDELSRPVKILKAEKKARPLRLDKEGNEYWMCSTCLIWKPKNVGYFTYINGGRHIKETCIECQAVSYELYGKNMLSKYKKDWVKERMQRRADFYEEIKTTKKRWTEELPSVYSVCKEDGTHIKFFTSERKAFRFFNKAAKKYDPEYKYSLKTTMFKIVKHNVH